MKPSKAQQEVVDKMREGYRIRYDTASQKAYIDGVRFSYATFCGIIRKGVIEECEYKYPNKIYQLTEKYRNNEGENI
jgi:hypothetical protein